VTPSLKKITIIISILLILSIGLYLHIDSKASLPIFGPEHFPFYSEKNYETKGKHTVSSFSFNDQNNQLITDSIFKNHITVVSFFYSNCNLICPVIIKRLKDVQDQFSKEERLKILSFSITPMIDTTDVLKQYEINHQINGQQWHLLTGSIDDVVQLARFSFFGQPSMKKDIVSNIHTETVFLVDSNHQIRGIYNSSSRHEMDLLKKDIQTLL
jgi:protein SCO1/2